MDDHGHHDLADERQEHLEEASGTSHDAHATGHDRHAGHSVAMVRDRFWLSLLLTLPVLLWSADLQEWFGYEALTFPGAEYLPAAGESATDRPTGQRAVAT
jgi:Cu2+-exporting ATPase